MFRQTIAQMLVALGVTLLGLLLFPGVALAHDLGFDSDLDENGIVQFANPQGIRPGLFTAAIDDWNQKVLSSDIQKGPIIVDVTNNPGAFVEVIVDEQGGDAASFVARVVFTTHPDNIDLSARFADLPFEKRLGTVTHELGHTRGHAHTGVAYCSTSVMPTRGTCLNAGEVRLESVGSHDVSDTDALWYGPNATHPVRNKCWTNQDADGDGECDRYGPPPGETAETDPGLPTDPPDAGCSVSSTTAVCNPTVSSVTPEDGAKDVTASANATATFSLAMDASTINTTTFTLTRHGDATPVAATVSYDPTTNKATLDPDGNLEAGATYTATIKGGGDGVKDIAGNALATEKVWSFTTLPDTTAPETTISSGTVNSGSATFTFSSSEAGSSFECSLDGAAFEQQCSSPKSYSGLSDGSHTFEVKATDAAGNTDASPASHTWTIDATAPTVDGVAPQDGASGVAFDANVEATFSEAMDASTVNGATFELTKKDSTTPVPATITYDNTTKTATLDPDADLKAATTYTVTIKGGANGVMDAAGNALTADKVWSFTTAAPADITP
jgi:Bacterial Ig-like domain